MSDSFLYSALYLVSMLGVNMNDFSLALSLQ